MELPEWNAKIHQDTMCGDENVTFNIVSEFQQWPLEPALALLLATSNNITHL